MKCATPFDLHDYYFETLAAPERRKAGEHLAACEDCAMELDRLRATALSLRAIPEEEIPRRIAFVSDKVFERSPVARWWQAFWLSGARVASAAMALLAVAIFVHAFRPAEPVRRVTPASVPAATAASVNPQELQALVDKAVTKAVLQTEARYDVKLRSVIAQNERQKRVTMERVDELLQAMDRRTKVLTVADNRLLERDR